MKERQQSNRINLVFGTACSLSLSLSRLSPQLAIKVPAAKHIKYAFCNNNNGNALHCTLHWANQNSRPKFSSRIPQTPDSAGPTESPSVGPVELPGGGTSEIICASSLPQYEKSSRAQFVRRCRTSIGPFQSLAGGQGRDRERIPIRSAPRSKSVGHLSSLVSRLSTLDVSRRWRREEATKGSIDREYRDSGGRSAAAVIAQLRESGIKLRS